MSEPVHLDTMPAGTGGYEDHYMHCGEEFAREYTNDVNAVTCRACLDEAQAEAEETAARCIERRIALDEAERPTTPAIDRPGFNIVADESIPSGRVYLISSPRTEDEIDAEKVRHFEEDMEAHRLADLAAESP